MFCWDRPLLRNGLEDVQSCCTSLCSGVRNGVRSKCLWFVRLFLFGLTYLAVCWYINIYINVFNLREGSGSCSSKCLFDKFPWGISYSHMGLALIDDRYQTANSGSSLIGATDEVWLLTFMTNLLAGRAGGASVRM